MSMNIIRPINKTFDKALKKAELMFEDQHFVSNVLDSAFAKLGGLTEHLYEVQDQMLGLIRMVRAWVKREYREVSPKAIIAMLAAIIYFVNPLDLISDMIPIIGFLDDITIITYVVTVFNKEIEKFMAWERSQAAL